MKTHDFYYDLPEELIAQYPSEHRDGCRLMVLDKKSGKIMEIYKTVILGKTVHFIIKGRAQDLDKSFQNAVFVYPSLRCDFDLEYNKDELSFDSDISAGFGLFLSRVRGYPVSDYELLTREGYRAFHLDNKVFCSSVGKCKVLCIHFYLISRKGPKTP